MQAFQVSLSTAGMSLVPVADIFNHKAAIVELSSDYVIEPVCFGDSDEGSSDNDGSSNSDEEAASNDTQSQSEPGVPHCCSFYQMQPTILTGFSQSCLQ